MKLNYYQSRLASEFFSKCNRVSYGSLNIEDPHGDVHNFKGKFSGPDATMQIKDWNFINNLINYGDIGLAESYMSDLWDSINLEKLLTFAALNEFVFEKYLEGNVLFKLISQIRRMGQVNNKSGSYSNVRHHYDLSNEFYRLWLDKSMTYSSALFAGDKSRSLEKAQEAKYDRIYTKLGLKPGDNVLDIGCGWGAFAEYLAQKGINIIAVTLSKQQACFANQRIQKAGLQDRATIRFSDYRDITGIFDYIVSIGMFEHVGSKYWQTYFTTIASHLRKGGKALIQTILIDEKFFSLRNEKRCSFITEYIFPGGCLPSHARVIYEIEKANLVCNESFVFGKDYAITLRHWLLRFENQLLAIKKLGFDEMFIRKWRFYLSYTIAGFISGKTSVTQFEIQH